jgi:hypothetical protein
VIGAMPNGPVEIWRVGDRREALPVATTLDLTAVLADCPFGAGRFWFWTGKQLELYEVERLTAGDGKNPGGA